MRAIGKYVDSRAQSAISARAEHRAGQHSNGKGTKPEISLLSALGPRNYSFSADSLDIIWQGSSASLPAVRTVDGLPPAPSGRY
eukprot:7303964-Pyramimonas_sp.AAC.1